MNDLVRLAEALDEAFSGPAWHGPTLLGSIRGLEPEDAAWTPGPGRNSIWGLVLHTAYWKYAARRRLTGGRRAGFARTGSNFFPLPEPADRAAWRTDVALLRSEHARLREAVLAFPASQLDERMTGSKWTARQLIRGIALHDIYHAGQIQLLKRLREQRGGRRPRS